MSRWPTPQPKPKTKFQVNFNFDGNDKDVDVEVVDSNNHLASRDDISTSMRISAICKAMDALFSGNTGFVKNEDGTYNVLIGHCPMDIAIRNVKVTVVRK